MSDINRVQLPVTLPCQYYLRGPAPHRARGLALLLHGYSQSGRFIFRRFEAELPPDWAVLAANAPFPIPGSGQRRGRIGYGWYFYDRAKDEYEIDMDSACEFLRALVSHLGYENSPKRLIGYSQGGYLGPLVATRLSRVEQFIGLACEYLVEEWARPLPFRIDAVHGDRDEVVNPAQARESFDRIGLSGAARAGSFRWIKGAGHELGEAMVAETMNLFTHSDEP